MVVLDVNNGKVKAMASHIPAIIHRFLMAHGLTADVELGQVFNDPGRPLINRRAARGLSAGLSSKVERSGLYTETTLHQCRYME